MGRISDIVAPPRLGRDFRLLLASSWISNIGDGFALAAGPLLVASQTRDPLLIAAAAFLQRLPWLLFGLGAGVLADRLDRRRLVAAVDLTRAAVLAVLTLAVVTDVVNVALVLVAMFLLGTAETFADVTTNTLLPMLVPPGELGIANSRLIFGFITANQLVGPPVGAVLFGLGMALPFGTQAVVVGLSAVLVLRISLTPLPAPARDDRRSIRRETADGLRWVWANPPIRTLTLTVVTFNVTFGAAWSVLVLYAGDRLGLGALGFGLLTTMSAVGGVVGSMGYRWMEERIGLAWIMRGGLVIETVTHLGLALTTTPAVAMVVLFAFGAHAAAWATTAASIRHRAVPAVFQGRVGSVYLIGSQGGLVVGAAFGGPIARLTGVTGPFWFAFAGSALILVLIWRQLGHIAHADGEGRAATSAQPA